MEGARISPFKFYGFEKTKKSPWTMDRVCFTLITVLLRPASCSFTYKYHIADVDGACFSVLLCNLRLDNRHLSK